MFCGAMEDTSIPQDLVGYPLVYGGVMKVGDLVKARHWYSNQIGIVLSIRKNGKICSVTIDGYVFDQLVRDLEVIYEGR